jgi:tRNA/rRNA methyltransferase
VKEIVSPRAAITDIASRCMNNEKVGLMFGPERTGLINDDLLVAEKLISIPANPDFSSYNLAQAVLILGYEWACRSMPVAESHIHYGKSHPATKQELFHFFDHLERELDYGGFFTTTDLKPAMVHNIRTAILRAHLTEQEVRTWHGMVAALSKGLKKKSDDTGQ